MAASATGSSGLPEEATEIDRPVRKRLTEKLGEATATEIDQVDAALRAVFDL